MPDVGFGRWKFVVIDQVKGDRLDVRGRVVGRARIFRGWKGVHLRLGFRFQVIECLVFGALPPKKFCDTLRYVNGLFRRRLARGNRYLQTAQIHLQLVLGYWQSRVYP
jgi:hypothetical protein